VSFASSEGIKLTLSDFNSISSNVVTQSGFGSTVNGFGIHVLKSNNNMLAQNVANDNQEGGILIDGLGGSAIGNILKQNTANFNYGSSAAGIRLNSARQSALFGNTANYNTHEGFEFFTANDNVISGNIANRNLQTGFRLDSSTGNMFSGNTAAGNIATGFEVLTSKLNTFKKNTAKNNLGRGFSISDPSAEGNMLISNTASGNQSGGIRVLGFNNVAKGNVVFNNNGDGLFFFLAQMATVSGNIVKNNRGDGIRLDQVLGSTISGNMVLNSDGNGIDVLSNSTGNTISGNTAMGNGPNFGGFDLFDASIGSGTAGTANTWAGNKALTRSPGGLL
jgi:parallel beta-helix repeat protein